MNCESINPSDESAEKPGIKWRTLAPKPPFAWQNKYLFQQIVSCPNITKLSTALWVYTAMTHISSDLESCKFQCAHGFIAEKAKVHPNTVKAVIPELEGAGVIQVLRSKRPGTKENEMNTYILLEPGWTPTVQRGIKAVRGRTRAATSELSSYRKSGCREETPDPSLEKDAATSSLTASSTLGRSAATKPKALNDEQRYAANVIKKEHAKDLSGKELKRFEIALHDVVAGIEDFCAGSEQMIVERIKQRLAPAIEVKPDEGGVLPKAPEPAQDEWSTVE